MIFGSLSFLESVSQSWQKYFHLNKTLNFLYMFSILQPLPNFCSSFTKVIAFGEMLQWFKEGGTSNSSSFYSLTVNVYNMISKEGCYYLRLRWARIRDCIPFGN